MLIDEIDFADLYRQQIRLANRGEKTAEHWDKRAPEMAAKCTSPHDSYPDQLMRALDLRQAKTLLDVGCGPGTVCLSAAVQLERVYGIDYSTGMIQAAKQRAADLQINNAVLRKLAWEDDWSDVPRCDIAVASRSTLVADLHQALHKLNQHARLRVYTTHPVRSTFVDKALYQALGRQVTELPNYIYAVNILWQMGITASVSFIRSPARTPQDASFERIAESINWSLGGISDDERQRLADYYQLRQRQGKPIALPGRDWALLCWQPPALPLQAQLPPRQNPLPGEQ